MPLLTPQVARDLRGDRARVNFDATGDRSGAKARRSPGNTGMGKKGRSVRHTPLSVVPGVATKKTAAIAAAAVAKAAANGATLAKGRGGGSSKGSRTSSSSGSDSDGSRATGRGRAPSTGSETSSGVSLSSGRGSSSGHSSKGGASTAQSGVVGGTPGKSRYGSPRRARGNVGVSSPAPKASHGRKLSLNLPNRELSGSSALAQAAATAAHGRTGRAAYRPRVRGATGGGTPLAHGPAPPAVPPRARAHIQALAGSSGAPPSPKRKAAADMYFNQLRVAAVKRDRRGRVGILR